MMGVSSLRLSLLLRCEFQCASGKLLLEHHGNGIGTQNRYHPTRGFLESSRTLRWTTNAHLQEYEMQLDDLGGNGVRVQLLD